MNGPKSLQKLKEFQKKVKNLFLKSKIDYGDLEIFNEEEKNAFFELATLKINELTGDQLDEFSKKIEGVISDDSKNHIWERNHNQITWAISALMQETGRMPTNREISIKSGLSRQSVHKHLKEYVKDPRFQEMQEQFQFMTSKVLAKIYGYAVKGDVRAARLYFETVKCFKSTPITHNQTNYIQINQVKISQENIMQLNSEQLMKVEQVLRQVIPINLAEDKY